MFIAMCQDVYEEMNVIASFYGETAKRFEPGYANGLSPSIKRITFLGHAGTELYGTEGKRGSYKADKFAELLNRSLPSHIEIIDLIGCEMGLVKDGDPSYAQRVHMELIKFQRNIQVNTFQSEAFDKLFLKENKFIAMEILIRPNPKIHFYIIGYDKDKNVEYLKLKEPLDSLKKEIRKAKKALQDAHNKNEAFHELLKKESEENSAYQTAKLQLEAIYKKIESEKSSLNELEKKVKINSSETAINPAELEALKADLQYKELAYQQAEREVESFIIANDIRSTQDSNKLNEYNDLLTNKMSCRLDAKRCRKNLDNLLGSSNENTGEILEIAKHNYNSLLEKLEAAEESFECTKKNLPSYNNYKQSEIEIEKAENVFNTLEKEKDLLEQQLSKFRVDQCTLKIGSEEKAADIRKELDSPKYRVQNNTSSQNQVDTRKNKLRENDITLDKREENSATHSLSTAESSYHQSSDKEFKDKIVFSKKLSKVPPIGARIQANSTSSTRTESINKDQVAQTFIPRNTG